MAQRNDDFTLGSALEKLQEKAYKFRIPLPSENEISEAERAIGVTFHADFKSFLRNASNLTYGNLEPVVILPKDSYLNIVQLTRGARKLPNFPRGAFPICQNYDDFYCMSSRGESPKVYLWKQKSGKVEEEWLSLADWMHREWLSQPTPSPVVTTSSFCSPTGLIVFLSIAFLVYIIFIRQPNPLPDYSMDAESVL